MDTDNLLHDLSLLTARLALGGTMAAHGAQKGFGAFGGPGIEGISKFMESLGFTPAQRYARALAATEMTSGALIVLGALGPVGPATLISVMLAAIELVHRPKGYFNEKGGFEMNTMYIALAILLANEGYGSFSVDALLGLHKKTRPTLSWAILVGGVASAMFMLKQRNSPEQPSADASTQRSSSEHGDIESAVTARSPQ